MNFYIETDQTGNVSDLYTDAAGYATPPTGAIQVTNEEGELLRRGFANYKYLNGAVVFVEPKRSPAEMWELIKAKRDKLTDTGGYTVGGKWFHSDQKSRTQQLGLVMLGANIPANTQWKTMDGTFVTMTQTLANQIFAAAAAFDMAAFAAAETHRAAMEASADPDAYDYSTGWPVTFA